MTPFRILAAATLLFATLRLAAADPSGAPETEFNPLPEHLQGQMVHLSTAAGHRFQAYVTGSDDADRGVVLVHDRFGLTRSVQAWADRFANLGYRALAVDLYGGRVTDDEDQADAWARQVKQPRADAELVVALKAVQAPGRPVAVMGWGFGARQALRLALLRPDAVAATVMYYGAPVTDPDRLSGLVGPVLGVFALHDSRVSPDRVAAFWRAMNKDDRPLELHVYNTDRGFADPSGPGYDGVVTQAAWAVTRAFLDGALQ